MWASYESPHIIITLYAFFKTNIFKILRYAQDDREQALRMTVSERLGWFVILSEAKNLLLKALYLEYLKPFCLALELYGIAKGSGGDPVA